MKITTVFFSLFIILFLSSDFAYAQKKAPDVANLKTYFLVILKKGPHRDQDSATVSKLQAGHLANIDRLYEAGKIDLAGPFAMDADWRGLFVFNVSSEEEVKELLMTDPAVSSGRLIYEIFPWMSQPGSCLRN